MSSSETFYPGIGADEEIARLEKLVGKITAYWAQVEDGLFQIFVIAVAGTWQVGDVRPYRAVFFTFSSYEGKMRMTHNAMKARYGSAKEIMAEWTGLRKSLNGFSELRNEIAHLTPVAKATKDKEAKAVVRLVPPFWKAFENPDFDKGGYSWTELTQALAPFWSFDPSLDMWHSTHPMLGYRLQEFTKKLWQPFPPATTPSSVL